MSRSVDGIEKAIASLPRSKLKNFVIGMRNLTPVYGINRSKKMPNRASWMLWLMRQLQIIKQGSQKNCDSLCQPIIMECL